MVVEQYPIESLAVSDPGIPTLTAVLDQDTMGKHVGPDVPRKAIRLQILKHHPGSRCTFEIVWETAEGRGDVVGKVYANDRSDVYRTMVEIMGSGFDLGGAYAIPRPLAYVPELRLLLQEKVSGLRAKQVFLTGSRCERERACIRCAEWLVKYHTTAPRSGMVVDSARDMESIQRWSCRIGTLGKPYASLAGQLSEHLEQGAPLASRRMITCPGHGSYNCNQIILAQARTIVLDWDTYDLADPCRDVARFLVSLQRLAFKYFESIHALDAEAEMFLRTYETLSPFKVRANLPWYRAFTCLKLAKYEVNRPVCTLREGIELLLREGLHVAGVGEIAR
jgi:hypothetical protein